MNEIFFVLIVASVAVLLFTAPGGAIGAMLAGGEKALQLSLTMITVYALWLGVLKVAENCGLTQKLAQILKAPVRWLFGNISPKAQEYAAMNLSANLLGMGGVATPMGISAAREMDKEGNIYAMNVLFVLAATSIQLLPTSVIALRTETGSVSAEDIILPTLIATAFSTVLAVLAVKLIYRRKKV